MKTTLLIINLVLFALVFMLSSSSPKAKQLLKKSVSFYDLKIILDSKKHGDTIYIENGVYNNFQITLKNYKPVVIIADTPGKVVFTDSIQITLQSCKNMTLSGFYFDQTASQQLIKLDYSQECIIENNLFQDSKGSSPYSKIIGLQNSSHRNIIRNNTFDNIETMGVTIRDKGSVFNKLVNNVFQNISGVKDIYPGTNGNGMESIQVGTNEEGELIDELHTTIKQNVFRNIIGDQSEVISVKSSDNLITKNEFYNCLGGVTLRIGSRNIVSNNYFIDSNQPIRLFGSNHIIRDNNIVRAVIGLHLPSANYLQKGEVLELGYSQSKNIEIIGNVIIDSKRSDILIGSFYSEDRSKMPINIKIIGNIITHKVEFANDHINEKYIYLKDNYEPKHPYLIQNQFEKLHKGKLWNN